LNINFNTLNGFGREKKAPITAPYI